MNIAFKLANCPWLDFGRGVIELRSLVVLSLFLTTQVMGVSCATRPAGEVLIELGMTEAQVKARLGDPVTVQQFQMPAEGFFGPQESLTGLVAAGTAVLEWQYAQDQQVYYVWFAHTGQAESEWSVVATGSYPADAVY